MKRWKKTNIVHQGIVKTKNWARDILFWNGIRKDIESLVSAVQLVQNFRLPIPRIPSELLSRPWSKIGMDLLELRGNHFLLILDYLSKWPELARLESLTSMFVITHVKSMISKYVIPDITIIDNGPQFSCYEFKEFVKVYFIIYITNSPYHAPSNGQTERMIKTMKRLINKSHDPYLALLEYRNTKIEVLICLQSSYF